MNPSTSSPEPHPATPRHAAQHAPASTAARALPESCDQLSERQGPLEALPPEYFEIVPASGMSATATDMAHFMIAHMQDGRFADDQILQRATAQDMHRRHFTNDPRLSGMAYGFVEQRRGDERILMHAGSTNFEQFQSYLMLLQSHDVGLFVSFNSEGGGPAKGELVEAFLDRYFPQPSPPQTAGVEDFAQGRLISKAAIRRPGRRRARSKSSSG